MTTFAQSLKVLMQEKRLTQQELADKIGISQTMISNYLKGESEPGVGIIIKLAKYFGVGVEFFYPELKIQKEDPKPEPEKPDIVNDYRNYNKHLIFENENLWDKHNRMFGIIEQVILKSAG